MFARGDIGFHFGTLDAAIRHQKQRKKDTDEYTIIAVDSGSSLDLFVQTMYVGQKKRSIANVTNADALIITPETSVGTAPTSSISENGENVNSEFQKNIPSRKKRPAGMKYSTAQEREAVRKIAERLGRRVVFEDVQKTQGVRVNGYIDGNNVIHIDYFNLDPITFVFKHELTHFGEGTKAYGEFREAVLKSDLFAQWLREKTGTEEESVAQMKAKYRRMVMESRRNSAPVGVAQAEAEMIADFVGDRLFTDNGSGLEAMISDIEVKRRPKVIRYLMDFVSYLKKKLSGLKEMDFDLSHLEDSFNRMLSEATQKNTAREDGVRYSANGDKKSQVNEYEKPITLNDVQTLRSIGRKSINEFTSEERQIAQKWAYKFYQELGTKSPFFRAWFGDWRGQDAVSKREPISIQPVAIFERKDGDAFVKEGLKNRSLFRGNVANDDTQFQINIGNQVYNDTLTYANREFSRNHNMDQYKARISLLDAIQQVTEQSILLDSAVINDAGNPYRTFMHYFYSVCTIGKQAYLVKLGVDELNSRDATIRRAYNVNNIKISPIAVSQVYKPAGTIGDIGDTVSTVSISDLFALVKQYDKEFNPKPVNKLLLEKNGEPKKFYHGTNSKFFEFDLEKSGANYGEASEGLLFFTSKKNAYPNSATDYAREITKKKGGKETVREVYVSMRKPLVLDSHGYYTTQAYFDQNHEKIYNKYLAGDYDGIIIHNSDKNADDAVMAIVDNAGQVKSATKGTEFGNIGTFDGKNPDIRYQSRKENVREQVRRMETVYDEMGERERLVEENRELAEDVEQLKALVAALRQDKKQMTTLTHGSLATDSSVDAAASWLLDRAGVTHRGNKAELKKRLIEKRTLRSQAM